jgi:hypothetical protein
MIIAYPVLIKRNKRDYLVFIPDFMIYTEGRNYADAIVMARDAIGCRTLDSDPPAPSDYARAIKIAKEDADKDFDYSDGILTLVDIDVDEYRRRHDNRVVKKNCTIPSWLNESATAAGINFSQTLQEALKSKLGL